MHFILNLQIPEICETQNGKKQRKRSQFNKVDFFLYHCGLKLKIDMARIFLIGFMGSGKSTYGKLMAQKLNIDFLDMDDYIEKQYSKSIYSLFEEWGEEQFRKEEKNVLRNLPVSDNLIIATGGGTPCFFDNMEFMNKQGETIYLRTSVRELRDRLMHSNKKRPLLLDKSLKDLEVYIADLLKKREAYYLKSRYILETDDLNPNNLISSYLALKEI